MPTEKMLKTVWFIERFTGKTCTDYTYAGVMNFIERYKMMAALAVDCKPVRGCDYSWL